MVLTCGMFTPTFTQTRPPAALRVRWVTPGRIEQECAWAITLSEAGWVPRMWGKRGVSLRARA